MSDSLPKLDGPRVDPASGGDPKSLVILLHGLGADGNDLIGLAPYWAPALPDTRFVSPNAPFPCDMAPMGLQWFSLRERDPMSIAAGIAAVVPIIDAFIDAELADAGLTPDRLVLVGFSQGTMTSLYLAPRRQTAIGGVLGYSGALAVGGNLADHVKSKPPMRLIHGTADPVVPFESMEVAESALSQVGIEVDSFPRPGLGHGIDGPGLELGLEFLQKTLGS